jgi:hypothetical protein
MGINYRRMEWGRDTWGGNTRNVLTNLYYPTTTIHFRYHQDEHRTPSRTAMYYTQCSTLHYGYTSPTNINPGQQCTASTNVDSIITPRPSPSNMNMEQHQEQHTVLNPTFYILSLPPAPPIWIWNNIQLQAVPYHIMHSVKCPTNYNHCYIVQPISEQCRTTTRVIHNLHYMLAEPNHQIF